jgi:hypothetical protein
MSHMLSVLGPEAAHDAARAASIADGAVAARIRSWAAAPSPATFDELVTAELTSPWHSVRSDPASVAGWSEHALFAPSVRTVADLRVLLDEPDDDATGLSGRFEQTGAWYPGPEAGARLAQLGVILGGMLWFGAGQLGARDSAWTRADHARRIEAIARTPIGHVASTVVALALAGAEQREQQVGDRRIDLPALAAQVAVAAMDPDQSRAPEDAFVHRESRVIRACHHVVRSLGGSFGMSAGALSWLAWRLYGWWSSQALASRAPVPAVDEMAHAAQAPFAPTTADPWDAGTLPDDGQELRELAMLEAIWAADPSGIDIALLRPSLIRVASRQYTDREAAVRRQAGDGPLGGPGLVAPDLAVVLLVGRSSPSWWTLDPKVRMRWLMDVTDAPTAYPGADIVRERLTVLWCLSFDQWTEQELAVVSDAVSGRPTGDRDADLLSIGAWGLEGTDALRARAEAAVDAHLDDHEPLVVGAWLLAAGVRGELELAVAHLRGVACVRDIDEVPLLRRLAWPLYGGHAGSAEQARAVLSKLAREPRLRAPDALADLFEQLAVEGA